MCSAIQNENEILHIFLLTVTIISRFSLRFSFPCFKVPPPIYKMHTKTSQNTEYLSKRHQL